MSRRRNVLIGAAAAALLIPVIGASVVVIGSNVGTAEQRCDRFRLSAGASSECHDKIFQAEEAQADASERRIEASQRHIEAIQSNIRNIDAAERALRSQQPAP